MDLAAAERLAAVADPRAVAQLQKHNTSPAVGRAVAEQFGTLLLQRVMQNGAGEPIAMTDGPGGKVVNAMYANTMSQALMSGDQLGLADLLYRAMAAKQQSATEGAAAAAQTAPAAASSTPAPAPAATASAGAAPGFSLAPYWQAHGLRPLGGAVARAIEPKGSPVAGIMPPPRLTAGADAAAGDAARPGPATATNAAALPLGALPPPADATPATGASSAQIRDFSGRMAPLLQQAAAQLGVSPRTLLAQAALETGWGRSVVGNNVFGIKAGPAWSGAGVCAATHEIVNGKAVAQTASFRAYPSLAAAVADYVSLISGSARYQSAIGSGEDAHAYGAALIAGGYATDASYPAKLAAVAASPSVTAAFPAQPALLAASQ